MLFNMGIKYKRILIRFLKENNCYNQFIEYLFNKEMSLVFNSDDNIRDFTIDNIVFIDENVINSFAWHMTREGEYFWNEIFFKWQKILNDLNDGTKKIRIFE